MTVNSKRHSLFLATIFLAAIVFNFLPQFLSGIPLPRQLSSDAENYVVHWYQYSEYYGNNFLNDKSFQYEIRPAGDLFVDKIFVRIGEFLKIDLPVWSVLISIIALLIFLSGVYALSFYTLNSAFSALIIGLGSIMPTFALGGGTWGFQTLGYLPRDLAIGFALWLLLLFIYGKDKGVKWAPFAVFLISGLFANWYPVLFFHFITVLLLADIIHDKKMSVKHLCYGLIFSIGAFFAIYDVISKVKTTIPPDLEALHMRFGYMYISSFTYGVFRYLRRVIIYLVWIPAIIVYSKKIFEGKAKKALSFWLAIWISAGVIMTVGVLLEQFTVYAKFLFSRTSLFFIFSSMAISTLVLTRVVENNFPNLKHKKIIMALFLLVIFTGQSSIPTVYRYISGVTKNADAEKSFYDVLTVLSNKTSSKDIILADPGYSNSIRAYAIRSVYTSWKDGGVSLLDGKGGREWFERFTETNELIQNGSFNSIVDFGLKKGASVVFIETNKISDYPSLAKKYNYYLSGNYAIILLSPKK